MIEIERRTSVDGVTSPTEGLRAGTSELRVALSLWRGEAVRLARTSIVPAALAVLMATDSSDITDLRAASFNAAFPLLPLAAVTLVLSHRAVTRPRRDRTDELLRTTPASARARTAAHLLAVSAPTLFAVAAVVFSVWRHSAGPTIGPWSLTELAVGPLLVAGAGCLGVLLGCVWSQRFTPYLACVAIAAVELGINTPRLAGSGLRWLAFWVEGSLWWALPRQSAAHVVYLVGLITMAAVGALLRHRFTRRLVAAGVAAVTVTTGAGAAQMRQPQSEWRRTNAMFAAPASLESCSIRRGVRYCVFEEFADLADHFEDMVGGVRTVVPPSAWPDPLTVAQRVTALDLQYVGDAWRWLPHVPAMPRERLRQPDDGAIHPAVEFGWSSVQEAGFGVQVAAAPTGLPLVPDSRDGSVCNAVDQARAVVALWAGAHATDDAEQGLERLVENATSAAESTGRAERDAVVPIADVDVYGGFAVSVAQLRLATQLLDRDSAADTISRRWAFFTNPATRTSQLAEALGVGVTDASRPQEPFVAHTDPDIVRLGSPCR